MESRQLFVPFELFSCYFDVIRKSDALTMHLEQAYYLHDHKKLPVTCIRPAVPNYDPGGLPTLHVFHVSLLQHT